MSLKGNLLQLTTTLLLAVGLLLDLTIFISTQSYEGDWSIIVILFPALLLIRVILFGLIGCFVVSLFKKEYLVSLISGGFIALNVLVYWTNQHNVAQQKEINNLQSASIRQAQGLSRFLALYWSTSPNQFHFTNKQNPELADVVGFSDYCQSIPKCRKLLLKVESDGSIQDAMGHQFHYAVDLNKDGLPGGWYPNTPQAPQSDGMLVGVLIDGGWCTASRLPKLGT